MRGPHEPCSAPDCAPQHRLLAVFGITAIGADVWNVANPPLLLFAIAASGGPELCRYEFESHILYVLNVTPFAVGSGRNSQRGNAGMSGVRPAGASNGPYSAMCRRPVPASHYPPAAGLAPGQRPRTPRPLSRYPPPAQAARGPAPAPLLHRASRIYQAGWSRCVALSALLRGFSAERWGSIRRPTARSPAPGLF
jgi:hypothetical protein